MEFNDIIKKSVLEGFSYSDISTIKIVVTLGICFLMAIYVFFVYRYITRTTFYNKDFNVSMAIISVVVAGIVIAMQSNLVISLGMVGALSIVRFRTAIKEPMDLLFLFWSISIGIMCGAGLYEVAFIVSIIVTIGILFFKVVPINASPYLIVVNASEKEAEKEILEIIKKHSPQYKIDSKNIKKTGINMIIEIRTKNGNQIVNEISEIKSVISASLLYHDASVKN